MIYIEGALAVIGVIGILVAGCWLLGGILDLIIEWTDR